MPLLPRDHLRAQQKMTHSKNLMAAPVYGKMERGPFEPYEEHEDAIRK